ncbi:MAG: CHAD domain-containing protein [Victivallales bacterium]|nr:CHAD domain-containing protein [Victivallales bacterium]
MNEKVIFWKDEEAAHPEWSELLPGRPWHFDAVNLEESRRMIWLETFDWRLWQRGLVLFCCGDFFLLYDLERWCEVSRQFCSDGKRIRFAAELPEGDCRTRVESAAGGRALLRLVALSRRDRSFSGAMAAAEPQLRLDLSLLRLHGIHKSRRSGMALLYLRRLSHDEVPGDNFEHFLSRHGFQTVSAPVDILIHLLRLIGRRPLDYSMKITTELTPDLPVGTAVMRLLHDNFRLIHVNETGIRADIDREFLHDYRVAFRRSRTLLTAFGFCFQAAPLAEMRTKFRHWANATNCLRDCDVLLESRDRYLALLPPELHPGLLLFFRRIATIRHGELLTLREALSGDKYHDFCCRWRELLLDSRLLLRPDPGLPIAVAAGMEIYRCYRKVVRGGRKLDADTGDVALHRVRIQCKKLRYLLEFFSGIFPPAVRKRVASLKKLQDTLGAYNDMAVQIATLQSKIDDPDCRLRPAAVAAVGGLIAVLATDKKRLRHEFRTGFEAFASERNVAFFRKYFRSEPP